MRIQIHLLILFQLVFTVAFSQSDLSTDSVAVQTIKDVGPHEWVMLEKEPVPINMDELVNMIGYPPEASAADLGGKVVLRIYVDENGKYKNFNVLEDPHPLLTQAVTSKIDHLQFEPGINEGLPVRAWITIPFSFELQRDSPIRYPKYATFYSLDEAEELPRVVKYLFLNGQNLKEVQEEVFQFDNLLELELGDNMLKSIPASISSLKNLEILGLSMNQLSSLPDEIWDIRSLKCIKVKGNAFPKEYQKWLLKNHGDVLFPKDKNGKVIW